MIDGIKEVRKKTRRTFEVPVSWVGFPGEDTWEELKILAADVPVRLIAFLRSTDRNDSLSRAALDQVRKLIKEQTGDANK